MKKSVAGPSPDMIGRRVPLRRGSAPRSSTHRGSLIEALGADDAPLQDNAGKEVQAPSRAGLPISPAADLRAESSVDVRHYPSGLRTPSRAKSRAERSDHPPGSVAHRLPASAAAGLASFAAQVDGIIADRAELGRLVHTVLGALISVTTLTFFSTLEEDGSLEACFSSRADAEAAPVLMRLARRCVARKGERVRRVVSRPARTLDDDLALCCGVATPLGVSGVVALIVPRSVEKQAVELVKALCVIAATAVERQSKMSTSRLLAEIIDRGDEAVSLYDASARILFTNKAYHKIFDRYPDPATLRGMSHEALYRLDLEAGIIDDPVALSDPERYLAERMHVFRSLHSDLREMQSIKARDYLYTRSRLSTGETFSRRIDITDMKMVEVRLRASNQRLEELAYIDVTTGLCNRVKFREEVDAALADGRRKASIVLVDIDRFRTVNEGIGDAAGDALLSLVAERLRGCVTPGDLLARLGGDQFAVCCWWQHGVDDMAERADRICSAFCEPFVVETRRIPLVASLGIAIGPEHGSSVDTLLQHARAALGTAKDAGGGQRRLFDAAIEAALIDRKNLALDLRAAVALGQLELHYQPLLGFSSRRIEGVEALVRWRHPSRGLIPPIDFIQLAEAIGLMKAIGEWVLHQALADARTLPADLTIAVNLSPQQIAHGDLVDTVTALASQHDFDLGRLELEVTESEVLQNDPAVAQTLQRLRAFGIGIALDDFGTGFSSLSYLLRFPFTKIKIDKSFVQKMVGHDEAAAIVASVSALAKRLGMMTTAEGVETHEQFSRLLAVECNQVQGYLIARPLPLPVLKAWLASDILAMAGLSAVATSDRMSGPAPTSVI